LAGDILIGRPGRRGIGRKTFVDQKKFVVRRADLEFGIGNDSSALRRMIDKLTFHPCPVIVMPLMSAFFVNSAMPLRPSGRISPRF
jgi:hypothetical protein